MSTTVLQRSISKAFPNKSIATAIEILFLLLIGVTAITLHAKLRIPMQLPGKHGILFMALLISARGLSKFPYATTISCMGAGGILLTGVLGFANPMLPLIYLFLGVVMDALFALLSKLSSNIFIISLAGGISWMFIPFARLVFGIFAAFDSKTFSESLYYPFFTHFIFGYLGALAGLGLVHWFSSKK